MSSNFLDSMAEELQEPDEEMPSHRTDYVQKEGEAWVFIYEEESPWNFVGAGPDGYVQLDEML